VSCWPPLGVDQPGLDFSAAGNPRHNAVAVSSVGVQILVEGDALTAAGHHFHGPTHRIAAEQQIVTAGQFERLDRRALGCDDLGARGDIQAGFDDAVVAQRDAQARVGAEQTPLADRNDFCATAGQRAMIDAPPPMSEPSPTTTPAEMRPSTIEAPRCRRCS